MINKTVDRDFVRWGVLGLARIAVDKVIPALSNAHGARLVAVASRDAGKAASFARQNGVARAFGAYQALLDYEAIDAIYIPLPNDLHFEWCVRALEAGKHVLCEKPLCLSSRQVSTLIEARERTGRHIEEAFSFRNHPQWQSLQSLLNEGTMGEVRAVQGTLARQFLDPDDIRNKPGAGGGALYDLGAYVISASNLVFGQAPTRVVAAIDRDPKFGIDRLSTMLLDYGGRHATFSVGTQTGPAQCTHQQFSVLSDKGWLRLDFPYAHARPRDCHIFIGDENSMGAFESKTLSFEVVDQYKLQIERFSRVLRGEPAPSWPIEDSRATLRTIEALFASALEGGWVNVQAGTQ